MPTRPCLGVESYCGTLTTRPDARCPPCATEWHRRRDARRGTAHQRGYDARHQATRVRLLPQAFGTPCPRCGQPMLPDQDLDLGHSTPLRASRHARADRIEHSACNRGARD